MLSSIFSTNSVPQSTYGEGFGSSSLPDSLTSSTGVSGTGATASTTGSQNVWDQIWQTDDFEEQEEKYGEQASQKDAIVFLLDCGPSMMKPMASGETPWEISVKCMSKVCTEKIIASPTDELCVVLYATDQQKGDFPGVYVLSDFDRPSGDFVKQIDALSMEDVFPFGHWADSHPGVEFPLCDAFWTASSLLGRVKVSDRRVFLFTDQDCPHTDEDQLQRARARLDDYASSGVEVQLFAYDRIDADFSLDSFYHALPNLHDGGRWKACSRLEAMSDRVTRKIMKKRSQATLKFTLGDGLDMSVRLYTMLRESARLPYVLIDPITSYPVKPQTKWACMDSGEILRTAQIKKYFAYGDAKVVFEADEIKAAKFLYPPGIQLLGFKSREMLKDHHNLQHANFLFPDETDIRGSSLAFRSLLQNMVEKDKIALVRYVPRVNSVARVAALVPSIEEYDLETGAQLQPSGFHLIILPYQNEIRKLEVEQDFEEATPSDEAVIAARKMVQTFTTDFDPHEFQNPSLQKHFRTLQAYALENNEVLAEFEDNVVPDREGMRQFEHVIKEWKDEIFPEEYEAPATGIVKKEPKKRALVREVEGYEGDWHDLVSNDSNAGKVTIPQIKQKLRELGITGRGKKADLWEQLKTAMEHVPQEEDEPEAEKPRAPKKVKKEKVYIKDEEDEEEEF